ncbi:MAG: hypothetical protein LBR97_05055 [Dysgonamonadaceae bacterium]|jgi:hypothetical protein|nr:hypothetical protein [Dysgonamonadaceae bacterium]
MKIIQFVFTVFAILFVCGQIQAQDELPYKSKAMFGTDTLRYLEYNYSVARSEKYYKGKTVGDILRELEYTVLYVAERAWCDSKIVSIGIGVRQADEEPDPSVDYYITVFFAHPPLLSDYRELYDNRDDKNSLLTPKIYDFLKNLEVAQVTFTRGLSWN